MTVTTISTQVVYTGNSLATNFPFPFLVPAAADLVAVITDTNGNQTVLNPTTYSISGLGSPGGGSITYPLVGSPLATGWKINISRVLTLMQQTSLEDQGGYYPDVVEAALDYLTMLCQQINQAMANLVPLGFNFSDQETPVGTINGSNAVFTIGRAPGPPTSLALYKNGILQAPAGGDYNFSGQTITYVAGAIPLTGDTHVCSYRY